MLKFYYHPLSPISRRVWLLLLEKQIPYQLIEVNLGTGKQFEPEFLTMNPFHHVPVIVDGDFRVFESIAILEYLELCYPDLALIPTEIQAITKMRMVQQVAVNELMPNLIAVVNAEQQPLSSAVQTRLATAWQFLDDELQGKTYFGGDRLNLGDIVAGATIPLFYRLGVSLNGYPCLDAWRERISNRPSWQQTRSDDPSFQRWQKWVQLQIKRKSKLT
ncbi:glutathione S-transferase family protein [Synechocystis sp. PCC 7509]|uniref:glutathione S-transferase family protein n=1 Tax=Synechocystis sp. PCC 7509 TaxID=927677 RepID=UPI0002AD172B|nr:glutathione S-transferase family protein [Synechocystis sp. PCC 7509]